jgi:TPR repeat protein
LNQKILTPLSHFLFIALLLNSVIYSQENDKSLAFKKNRPQKKYTIFYQPDLSYQIQKQFNLIRDANAGIALAQHELGLRYLLGEDGMTADTIKGAYWVGKAAEQNLTAACYNYGILLINGWGVDWNPFKAFDYFNTSASDGMPQAQHLVGILYADNLIVKRDYIAAYKWVKKASDQNYAPALETKKELEKYLPAGYLDEASKEQTKIQSKPDAKADSSLSSQLGLVFIDFESIQDTIREVKDSQLINDLFHEFNLGLADTLGLKLGDSTLASIRSERISVLEKFAESGNSEALTIIGRFYEEGIFYENNLISAALNYILASQLSYPRAKFLLLKIISPNFVSDLIYQIKNENNSEAMFVFYGLWSLGLYNQIIKEEALKYLTEAANKKLLPAIIELGNNFYSGKNGNSSVSKGIELWTQAAQNGSRQAQLRLAAVNIIDGINIEPIENSINVLKSGLDYGSVLAQITLAYAYENGIGVQKSKAEAVKYYRLTAQRGNQAGYDELKRLYDEIRPSEKRFILD